MFMNGAGTGIVIAYQTVRLKRVRRLGLTAVSVAADGTKTSATSARLLSSSANTRATGSTDMASVLCERQNE